MSRLGKLYEAIETLRKENLALDQHLMDQVDKLEEDIIKKEILPVVTETIEPSLRQVKRDLVLVVEYHPEEPVKVALSRKVNIRDIIGDAKLIEPDPVVNHREGAKRDTKSTKGPKTLLRVSFPDGTVIQDRKAKVTFAKTIEKIGLMRVRNLGITLCGVPLVSNTQDKKYAGAQIPTENGLYIMTHSSTEDKKKKLDALSGQLKLGLKVDVI